METEGSQIHSRNVSNLPIVKGVVEDTEVKTLRDGGCSGVVVRLELVHSDQYTKAQHVCYLINGTVQMFPVARVHI